MIKIPKKFMGKPIKGSLEKVLANIDKAQQEPIPEPNPTTASDKQDYIFVPKSGVYLAKQRTHLNLDWYETHKALHQENLRMHTIPEFIEYLNYLKTDYQKQGQEQKQEAEQILDDILTVRSPWRSEWLDARFEEKGGNKKIYVHYNHKIVGGELKPQNTEELLDGYLKADCWADIFNPNKQGLPTKKSGNSYKQGENAYFWYPIAGRVARFDAYPDGAGLSCDRYLLDYHQRLGVFSVCEANSLQ